MSDAAQPLLRNKIMKILGKFSSSRLVRAVMGASYSIIVFSIIGPMFLVLTVLTQTITAKGFVDFYNNAFERFNNIYTVIYNATMSIIAIYFAGSFAHNYTDIHRKEENLLLDPLSVVLLTLMGLFITVPQLAREDGNTVFVNILKKDNVIADGYGVSSPDLTRIGATGIFTGLVAAWLAIQTYHLCIKHNQRIEVPVFVPLGVANPSTTLVPDFVIVVVIALIDVILIVLGTDIFQLLFIPLPFVSNVANTWWGVLVIFFLIHSLWWFGVHGVTIIPSFYQAIVLLDMAANTSGIHYAFIGEFSNTFVIMGGSGATLGMALWMALASRSKQLREPDKLEAAPAVFNINEPLLFGSPTVYNVRLFVPSLLTPMTCLIVAYAAIATHLVPKIIVQQPWPTPVGLGGTMATASWQGIVLALVNVVVAFLVWHPSIKHYDNELFKEE